MYNVILCTARPLLWARENTKIESHPFYHVICVGFLMEMQQKKRKKWTSQKNWDLKKKQFLIFSAKISGIASWVSRIIWCEEHQPMVRLSDVRSKTSQNFIFILFYLFQTLLRPPDKHIGWATLICPTNPRTNPWNLHGKILRFGGF